MSISKVHSNVNPNDLRRRRRYTVDARVFQVWWIATSGKMETTRTRALNVSEHGIALQLPTAAMRMRVRFQSDRFKLYGSGDVRYCHRAGAKYVVGAEFNDDLHWSPPKGDVHEPIPLCDPESASPPIFP